MRVRVFAYPVRRSCSRRSADIGQRGKAPAFACGVVRAWAWPARIVYRWCDAYFSNSSPRMRAQAWTCMLACPRAAMAAFTAASRIGFRSAKSWANGRTSRPLCSTPPMTPALTVDRLPLLPTPSTEEVAPALRCPPCAWCCVTMRDAGSAVMSALSAAAWVPTRADMTSGCASRNPCNMPTSALVSTVMLGSATWRSCRQGGGKTQTNRSRSGTGQREVHTRCASRGSVFADVYINHECAYLRVGAVSCKALPQSVALREGKPTKPASQCVEESSV